MQVCQINNLKNSQVGYCAKCAVSNTTHRAYNVYNTWLEYLTWDITTLSVSTRVFKTNKQTNLFLANKKRSTPVNPKNKNKS